ncbi:MAG: ion channel [Pseudomonadota bacterium]
MANQVAVGVAVMILTAYIHTWALGVALTSFDSLKAWARRDASAFRLSTVMAATMIWVMSAHLLEVGVWALVFIFLGIFDNFSVAVYFALVAYTTLGFGDIILPEDWRILSGMAAANGFLVFGWSTAFQVEILNDLRRADG